MNTERAMPWFKFWPSEWLLSPSVCALSPVQRGLLIELMCHDWMQNGVPSSPKEVRRLLRVEAKADAIAGVLALFTVEHPDGRRTHPWMEKQRCEALARMERASKGGHAKQLVSSRQAPLAPCYAPSREPETDEEKEKRSLSHEEGDPNSFSSFSPEYSVPPSEDAALNAARITGAPEVFVRELYHQLNAVGWMDAAGRPVVDWMSYVTKSHLKRIKETGGNRPKKTEPMGHPTDEELNAKHQRGF